MIAHVLLDVMTQTNANVVDENPELLNVEHVQKMKEEEILEVVVIATQIDLNDGQIMKMMKEMIMSELWMKKEM